MYSLNDIYIILQYYALNGGFLNDFNYFYIGGTPVAGGLNCFATSSTSF